MKSEENRPNLINSLNYIASIKCLRITRPPTLSHTMIFPRPSSNPNIRAPEGGRDIERYSSFIINYATNNTRVSQIIETQKYVN